MALCMAGPKFLQHNFIVDAPSQKLPRSSFDPSSPAFLCFTLDYVEGKLAPHKAMTGLAPFTMDHHGSPWITDHRGLPSTEAKIELFLFCHGGHVSLLHIKARADDPGSQWEPEIAGAPPEVSGIPKAQIHLAKPGGPSETFWATWWAPDPDNRKQLRLN